MLKGLVLQYFYIYIALKPPKDGAVSGIGASEGGPERKITRWALGVDGGYNDETKRNDIKDTLSIIVRPDLCRKLQYPAEQLSLIVTQSVAALLTPSGVQRFGYVIVARWGKNIPPSGWKCEKCDLK